MITLKEIDNINFNDCIALERKSTKFVGDATYVLAEAYSFREHSTTYGIYNDDTVVGLVTVGDVTPKISTYGFTNLFIADNHQGKGYGKQAVAAIIEKCKNEHKSDIIQICVHEANDIALHVYKKCGFIEKKRAYWDNSFIELEMTI